MQAIATPVVGIASSVTPAAAATTSPVVSKPVTPKNVTRAQAAAASLLGISTPYTTQTTLPPWASRFTGAINGVKTNKKIVALTFDDGPTRHTKTIVRELNRYDAHATFFWVGSRITTDAAKLALANGDELANHTWNHVNMHLLSSKEASAEIGLTNARIAQLTGVSPVWFRSPFNRLYRREYAQLRAHHVLYANYSVTSVDWMDGVTEAEVVGKVSTTLKPGGVILMHDSPTHAPSFVPAVLRLLKRRGYRVVTLSELARTGPPVKGRLTLGVQGLHPY